MLRSFFFAIGFFVTLMGVSLVVVDHVVLRIEPQPTRAPQLQRVFITVNGEQETVFQPPQWVAFSCLSFGAVTTLYSVALPRRHRETKDKGKEKSKDKAKDDDE